MKKEKCLLGCLKENKKVVNKKNVILNLFQDLIRLLKWNKVEMLKRVQHDVLFHYKAFTLIELLVVVLIIGILAAVALPQYQVAVAKSKFTKLIPTVKAMKDGMEMYHMANGGYPPDGDSTTDVGFAVEVATDCSGHDGTNWITCPNGIYFDRMDAGQLTVAGMDSNIKLAYLMWLDNSAHPGEIRCVANGDIANKVCKSMGGTVVAGESFGAVDQRIGAGSTTYKIN